MSGKAAAFLRPDGGNGFGHVGWGLQLPSGNWFVGSMENPSGWPVNLPGWTGFWYCEVKDPLAAMRNPTAFGAPKGSPRYKSFKTIDILSPSIRSAQKKIQEWSGRPFLATGGNCLNCTYDVLLSFGAGVPDPTPNPALWVPNNWFGAVQGVEKQL